MYTFASRQNRKNNFATSSCRLVWLRRLRTQRKMRDASDSPEKAGPEIYKTNPILGGGIKHFFSPAADFATRPMTSIDARRHWWGATASTCAPVDNSCEAGELAHVGHRRAATSKKPESRKTQNASQTSSRRIVRPPLQASLAALRIAEAIQEHSHDG